MTENLNLARPRLLRWLGTTQAAFAVFVCAIALTMMGPQLFAANGLAVLGAHGMPQAGFWRIAGFAVPGVLMLLAAGWLWQRSDKPLVRMGCVLFVLAGLMHALQALIPLQLEFLLHPDNERAALLNTVWWLSATVATVLIALSFKPARMEQWVLAAVVVTLAILRVAEVLPGPYQAITGWLQLVAFSLAVGESVRLT